MLENLECHHHQSCCVDNKLGNKRCVRVGFGAIPRPRVPSIYHIKRRDERNAQELMRYDRTHENHLAPWHASQALISE